MQLQSIQSLIKSINTNITKEINSKTIFSCSATLIVLEKLSDDELENKSYLVKFIDDTSMLIAELNAIINTEEIKNSNKLINNVRKQFNDVFNRVMEPINVIMTNALIDELAEC